MTAKRRIQLTIDILMTISLPLLMAYSLIGEKFHEVLGVAMGCIFVIHNILNRWWHKNIFYGRYNAMRILTLIIDIVLIIDILLLMVSGINLSTFVFSFINVESAYMASRLMHLCAAYWGFLLMSFHAGMHIPIDKIFPSNIVLAKTDKNQDKRKVIFVARIILLIITAVISGVGIFCFIKHKFFSYLFLRTHFVFLDFDRRLLFFFAEYTSIMFLFAMLGLGTKRLVRNIGKECRGYARKIIFIKK